MVVLSPGRREMRVAIDLDGKLYPRRLEVEGVAIDTVLPAKSCSKLRASEVLPQRLLSGTGVAAQGRESFLRSRSGGTGLCPVRAPVSHYNSLQPVTNHYYS